MDEAIRVLCVFGRLNRGGAETMCMNLYRTMDKKKVQFDFVKHTNEECDYDEEIKKLGGRVFSAPRYRGFNHLEYVRWWKKFLDQHPEDKIVHGHFSTTLPIISTVAHKKDCTYTIIAHVHTDFNNTKYGLRQGINNALVKMNSKSANYLFACSKRSGEYFFANRKVFLLKNAINLNLYQYNEYIRKNIRSHYDIRDDEIVIGAVGRMDYPKNPLGIVDILFETIKIKPSTKLLWVGNHDTDCGKEALKKAEDIGVKDNIIMTGVVTNVNELLQAMDCFIMPSFFEGLSVAAIEAQATGLPCFLGNNVSKEVEITDNCTFLPIDNPQLWAKKISECNIERVDTSQQIKDAGYDIHETAKWLQEFYLSL